MLTSLSDAKVSLDEQDLAKLCPKNAAARLRVLATTDLHMNMTSFDYYTDQPDPTVGMTRTASLIRQARAEAQQAGITTILLDNGDTLQGTPLSEFALPDDGQPHVMVQALDLLQYDAIGLGNHDFNFGLTALDSALSQLRCPAINSNVHRLDNQKSWVPYTILKRTVTANDQDWPLTIGVFSVLPPQAMDWDAHLLRGKVEIDDILSTAQQAISTLKAQGCHLIIALAHTGLQDTIAAPALENAAIPLADLKGLDAVIAGHTHLLLPGPAHAGLEHVEADTGMVHGKPTVMPGSAGSHLGLIDLSLRADGRGGWDIAEATTELRPIFERVKTGQPQALVPEDTELAQLITPFHTNTRTNMQRPVGASTLPYHSYFTYFAPDRGLAQVAAAQAAALRAYVNGTAYADLPLLSASAPSKFGGRAGPEHYTNVPAGPILLRHVADLHVFPNELHGLIVTGAQLRDWLEMAAGLYHQIQPGSEGATLINPEVPGHNFDVIFGIEYQIDPSHPARFDLSGNLIDPSHHRIRNLCYKNQPVSDTQEFVVAVNNYRANGGGHFKALTTARPVPVPSRLIQHIVRDYLMGRLPHDPIADLPFPWHFTPQKQTRTTVHTSPSAALFLDELQNMAPIALEQDDEGFARYSLLL
jgi:2',3'-cyclic-nucleotide 2'-phosphodiesterase / 3'-nucleotidase